MTLDVEPAREAVGRVAEPMGRAVARPREGIIDIVNENMLGALRVVTVQRGVDPRNTALVAFGGAGPLHANALGRLLGAYPVIVPPDPGVLSALGFVAAGFANEFNQTLIRPPPTRARRRARRSWRRSAPRARLAGRARASPRTRSEVRYAADMRYRRQGYEIAIEVDLDDLATLERSASASRPSTSGSTASRCRAG